VTNPDPTQTTPTEWPAPVSTEPPPPFVNGMSFDLVSPVNLEQLTEEINAAVGRTVGLAISGPINGNAPISPVNSATLAVTPANVNREAINKVLAEHAPQQDYGVPDSRKRFSQVIQKVVDNQEVKLTAEELQVAVRGLLMRSTGPTPR
jgi:hypothetical protein